MEVLEQGSNALTQLDVSLLASCWRRRTLFWRDLLYQCFVFVIEHTGGRGRSPSESRMPSNGSRETAVLTLDNIAICRFYRRDELARLLTSRADTIDVDLGGEGGATSLHLAAAGGFEKCATNLLENGASPVVKNDKGQVR